MLFHLHPLSLDVITQKAGWLFDAVNVRDVINGGPAASYMRSPGEKELLLHCVIHVISFLTSYSSHYMPESFLSSSAVLHAQNQRARDRETLRFEQQTAFGAMRYDITNIWA